MISTISAQIPENTDIIDILKATFPMGSMTGAPKISAMKLIEEYEQTKRGLFSGSVGYIEPNGDFDFNVIIRSLQYNSRNKYLSLMTGGAITYKSNAEDEYNESLLKAESIIKALQ
jgi:para-aminobenzoate synthetase component 1